MGPQICLLLSSSYWYETVFKTVFGSIILNQSEIWNPRNCLHTLLSRCVMPSVPSVINAGLTAETCRTVFLPRQSKSLNAVNQQTPTISQIFPDEGYSVDVYCYMFIFFPNWWFQNFRDAISVTRKRRTAACLRYQMTPPHTHTCFYCEHQTTSLFVHFRAMHKLGSPPIGCEDFCVLRLWGNSCKTGVSV